MGKSALEAALDLSAREDDEGRATMRAVAGEVDRIHGGEQGLHLFRPQLLADAHDAVTGQGRQHVLGGVHQLARAADLGELLAQVAYEGDGRVAGEQGPPGAPGEAAGAARLDLETQSP